MKVCSLFSGIGGIDLAFVQAGHEIVWANDNNKYACKTYRHNFPSHLLIEDDIRKIDKRDIPDCDIIAAGFPCQPFSVCGKQQGFDDDRGALFFEICKVIDEKQPKIVFLENVANLVNHKNGKTFNIIHSELARRDYYVRYIVADACEYGIPQHRTRSYILAFKDKEACDRFVFSEKTPLTKHIVDIIDTGIKAEDKYYFSEDEPKFGRLKDFIEDETQLYRFADWGIQASKEGIAFTLKANMGTFPNRVPIIKDKFGIRRITPEECLLLQGFPKSFSFPDIPDREKYKQAGNTVCKELIKKILYDL